MWRRVLETEKPEKMMQYLLTTMAKEMTEKAEGGGKLKGEDGEWVLQAGE